METGKDMSQMNSSKKIWCSVGDDYDTVAYDDDTPCKKGNRIFLLKDATIEDGDFQVYSDGGWCGPVAVQSKNTTFHEQMYINLYLSTADWECRPPDESIEKIRIAIEKALLTDHFKSEVEKILKSAEISVVARTNVFYGD